MAGSEWSKENTITVRETFTVIWNNFATMWTHLGCQKDFKHPYCVKTCKKSSIRCKFGIQWDRKNKKWLVKMGDTYISDTLSMNKPGFLGA